MLLLTSYLLNHSGLLWEQAAQAIGLSMPIFTVLICTIGGLLVGALVKVFGDHTGIFAEMMLEFGRTGRCNYRHAPGIVSTALVSLIAGSSLGPEAPMADACGSLGTWTADKLKMDERSTRAPGFSGLSGRLAAFITSPFGGALLGLVKLLITSTLLATGWKGGYIFPTMFAGVALGMAAHLIFPSIPMAVAVAATMGGAMVATMKAPIFSALFVAVLVQKEAGPVIAIAVIVGLLATARLSMTPLQPDEGQKQNATQTQEVSA